MRRRRLTFTPLRSVTGVESRTDSLLSLCFCFLFTLPNKMGRFGQLCGKEKERESEGESKSILFHTHREREEK